MLLLKNHGVYSQCLLIPCGVINSGEYSAGGGGMSGSTFHTIRIQHVQMHLLKNTRCTVFKDSLCCLWFFTCCLLI